jgi:hypothetical protein
MASDKAVKLVAEELGWKEVGVFAVVETPIHDELARAIRLAVELQEKMCEIDSELDGVYAGETLIGRIREIVRPVK